MLNLLGQQSIHDFGFGIECCKKLDLGPIIFNENEGSHLSFRSFSSEFCGSAMLLLLLKLMLLLLLFFVVVAAAAAAVVVILLLLL